LFFKLNKTDSNIILENYEILLGFFASFIFTWILTEFSSEHQFKEKKKDLAIRSFRHSRNLISKIEYSILISNSLNSKSSKCSRNNDENCTFTCNLNRIRDLLITFKKDANEIKNDWSDEIAEDIMCFQEIELTDFEIIESYCVIQDDESTEEDAKQYRLKVKELEKNKKNLLNKLDKRVKLALQEQSKLDKEILTYMHAESRFNFVRNNNIEPDEEVDIPVKKGFAQQENQTKTSKRA